MYVKQCPKCGKQTCVVYVNGDDGYEMKCKECGYYDED